MIFNLTVNGGTENRNRMRRPRFILCSGGSASPCLESPYILIYEKKLSGSKDALDASIASTGGRPRHRERDSNAGGGQAAGVERNLGGDGCLLCAIRGHRAKIRTPRISTWQRGWSCLVCPQKRSFQRQRIDMSALCHKQTLGKTSQPLMERAETGCRQAPVPPQSATDHAPGRHTPRQATTLSIDPGVQVCGC